MSRMRIGFLVFALLVHAASGVELCAIDDTSLYIVDPETGAATAVGVLNPPVPGLLGGLDWANGVLYGLAGTPGNALWTVDPSSGATSRIGALGVGGIYEGGLAFDGEAMWGVNAGVFGGGKHLVRIDLLTGAATSVGQLGPTGDHDFNGLAIHEGELYGIDRVTNALWHINRANPGVSTQIGGGFGIMVDLGVKGGMAGELAYADDTQNFFRVNFATGGAQVLADTSVRLRSLAPLADPASAHLFEVPQLFFIEAIHPNPTMGGTQIRFVVPADAHLTLAIYDAGGRLVRTLADGRYQGRHVAVWDGRSELGWSVHAGVYYVMCQSRGGVLRERIVVLR